MTINSHTTDIPSSQVRRLPKIIHLLIVFVIYILLTLLSFRFLSQASANKDFLTILSCGAIIASFGSALAAAGTIWAGDYNHRVALSIEILYRDILKQEAWRRWPFLPRKSTYTLLSGEKQVSHLNNPIITLNVGSHLIKPTLPTVSDDFFDLPILDNLYPLLRFRSASRTFISSKESTSTIEGTGFTRNAHSMVYECLLDIWISVCVIRLSRYLIHSGIALIISSTVIALAGAYPFLT